MPPAVRPKLMKARSLAWRVRSYSSSSSPLVVDMHSHFLPARWPDFSARHGGEAWPWMRHSGQPAGTFGYGRPCHAMLMQGEREFRPVTRACWDAAGRVADMDKAGVDLQLISATPILFQWQRPPKVALDVARHFNDAALEMCASRDAHGRLLPLCQVPLQSVDDACLEVERAMAAGHVGVQIGNHVGTRDLDADELVAFLSHCASIRAPVLVHPWDMDDLDGRLTKYMMGWTVGMPMETHLSITAMILGGAFDRLPRELDLCFAHGGGAFAFLLGRLENAWHNREIAKGKALHPPSHYLDRFSVDSAVFDARALRLLIDTFGAHRVMLGSDYPFPLGEQLVGDLVRTAPTLTETERRLILGTNAAKFFRVADKLVKQPQQQPQPQPQQPQQLTRSAGPPSLDSRPAPALGADEPLHIWYSGRLYAQGHGPPAAWFDSNGVLESLPSSSLAGVRAAVVPFEDMYSGLTLSQGHRATACWFDEGVPAASLRVLDAPRALPNLATPRTMPPSLPLHLPRHSNLIPLSIPLSRWAPPSTFARFTPPVAHAAAGRSRVPVVSTLLSAQLQGTTTGSGGGMLQSSRGVHSPPTRGGHTALTRGADKTPSSQPYTPPVAHAAAGLSRVPVRAGRTWSALGRLPKRSYATAAAASGAGGLNHVLNFVDGQPLAATGGSLPLIDAATGRVRGSVAASSAADVDAAVDAARRAPSRGEWAAASMAARAAVLQRAADLLDAESEAFAQAEAADVGKPVALARALDVPRAAANLRMFAGLVCHGELASVRHGGGGDRSGGLDDALNYTIRKPVGVVGLITPWNLPLYLLTWKLAPALAMGNAVVAKPSELTPTTASMLARVLERAGLPPGVFNVVHGTGAAAGAALCAHPRVGAISFTGGTVTGSLVAAAVAPRFAKLSLELGGKNPLLVFADCDLDLTVQGAVRASFLNSGQICLCASRILVEDTADGFYERFAAAFANAASALKLGAPTDPTADMGPLVSAAQRAKVSALYRAAVGTDGVRTLAGGLEDPRAVAAHGAHQGGHWFAPTVLDGLPMDAPLPQTEAFGPLVTLHPFTSEAEAVEMANATQYGLAASVWTEDLSRAHTIASRLEVGTVWVNCWLHRQLHMPFGGVKSSGVAREGGMYSLDFYSEESTICMKLGNRTPPPMPGRAARVAAATVAPPPPRLAVGAAVTALCGAATARSSAGFARQGGGVRALNTALYPGATGYVASGNVASAPKPMGAYAHAREAGGLLFLAGIGPRDPATDSVPGGSVEAADGSLNEYDARAQTRQCIQNVRTVLEAHGLGLDAVVDVHAFLVNMKRDFAAFNAEYATAFGKLPEPPVRTTVEVGQLPPGGRIAVELKVIAKAPSVYFVPAGGIPESVRE